jgi:hypothetical protein
MKRLSIALLCSFVAIGAYAGTPASKETPKAATAAATKVSEGKTQFIAIKGDESAFRRQMAFTFYDNCGGSLTVYVSGGNALPDSEFAQTAYNYACGYANAGGGCF